jgi:hypothetical protein
MVMYRVVYPSFFVLLLLPLLVPFTPPHHPQRLDQNHFVPLPPLPMASFQ